MPIIFSKAECKLRGMQKTQPGSAGDVEQTKSGQIREFFERPPLIFYFLLILLGSFLFDPGSYAKSWNEGRSALLGVVPLAALEMWGDSLAHLTSRRSLGAYLVVAVSWSYYWVFDMAAFTGSITNWGISIGVDPAVAPFSLVQGVDYLVTGIFLLALVLLIPRSPPVTPLLYTFGLAIFLFLDSALPFDSLGPLQVIVVSTLPSVAVLSNLIGIGHVQVSGNLMLLTRGQYSQALSVYWPSAGVDGIIIAVLVVVGVAAKLRVGWLRGVLYVVLAAVGSYIVDLLRLVVLVEYAMQDLSNTQAFETFHSYIGDLIFIPWT